MLLNFTFLMIRMDDIFPIVESDFPTAEELIQQEQELILAENVVSKKKGKHHSKEFHSQSLALTQMNLTSCTSFLIK
jgi:hypothetical protein